MACNNAFKTKLICQYCGGDFYVYTCSLKDKRHRGKYCSTKCCGLAKRMVKKPATKECTGCHKELPYTNEYFACNKSKVNTFGLMAQCKKCYADSVREKNKIYQKDLRKLVLTKYGKNGKLACVCCGEGHYEFLCLDHIHGDGGKERRNGLTAINLLYKLRRLNFPKGDHRTLCCNCHQAYGEHGFCPHQKERS